VAPAELEALLVDHPRIADAAVVGVTINEEEVPRAYVVLQPGSKTTEKEIAAWVEKRVSRTKRLLGGVVFVDVVPKNPVSTTNSANLDLLCSFTTENWVIVIAIVCCILATISRHPS